MIDFRFFIISIVAVFLALGIGIVLGSGFFGDPIINEIERQVDDALGRNEELEDDISELEARLSEDQDFMAAVEPVVLEGKLASAEVVLVEIDGTDEELRDGIRNAVELAGGEIVAEVRVNDRLELTDPSDQQELARILEAPSSEPEELRLELGDELGNKLSALASFAPPTPDGEVETATARADQMIDELADAGFLSIDAQADPVVPQEAAFVIAAGSSDEPGWPVNDFVESLASSLSVRRVPAVAAETSDSAWGVVPALREGEVADAALSTVDHAETAAGRIRLALALDEAPDSTGHYGTGEGASASLPTSSD